MHQMRSGDKTSIKFDMMYVWERWSLCVYMYVFACKCVYVDAVIHVQYGCALIGNQPLAVL